jgi:molecular chaperone GrpE
MTPQPERGKPAGVPDEERRPAGAPRDGGPTPAEAPDHTDVEQNSEAAAQEVERDLEALEETKRERDEYLALAQRTKADFENYRKRVAGETEAARRRGKTELAAELVPVLDNLERALIAAGIDPRTALAGEVPLEGVLEQGVVLTYRDLHEALERAGVEAYDPSGEKFDPEWHQALSTRAEDGTEQGVVLETLEKGYRLDGQVIRAARVVVSE